MVESRSSRRDLGPPVLLHGPLRRSSGRQNQWPHISPTCADEPAFQTVQLVSAMGRPLFRQSGQTRYLLDGPWNPKGNPFLRRPIVSSELDTSAHRVLRKVLMPVLPVSPLSEIFAVALTVMSSFLTILQRVMRT